MILSKRLATITKYIQKAKPLADIGSDHAQIPIVAVNELQVPFAIAGEVAEGPWSRSLAAVQSAHLEDQIDVRLGDGLEVLKTDDPIAQVVIAGMGGQLITQILKRGLDQQRVKKEMTFILQANKDVPELRKSLLQQGFFITNEDIVAEGHFFYEIVVCTYNPDEKSEEWSQEDLLFGRYVQRNSPAIFEDKWHFEQDKLQKIKEQLHQSDQPDEAKLRTIDQQLLLIKERLDEPSKTREFS